MFIRSCRLRAAPLVMRALSTGNEAAAAHQNQPQQKGDPAAMNTGHDGDYGSPENFEQHWTTFFANCPDEFELQRGLNNCFNYDIVPPVAVVEAAMLAARRVNSFATGVRLWGGLREKVPTAEMYRQYREYFAPMMEASGLVAPEDLGRE